MKHYLFLALAASAMCLNAATPAELQYRPAAASCDIRPSKAKTLPAKTISKPAKGLSIKSVGMPNGRTIKKMEATYNTRFPKQTPRRRAPKAADASSYSLYESFEGWDGQTLNWAPTGWSIESKGDATLEPQQKWGADVVNPDYGYPAPPDGTNACFISYAEVSQDEWLLSPTITVAENEILTFSLYTQPFFFYDQNYINEETLDFTEKHVVCDIEVHIKADGGEWQKCWSMTDQYTDMSGMDMMYAGMEVNAYQLPLTDYVGKTVQFAFRYVGANGDSAYLDAISVGLPSLEGVCYTSPFETLYWGYDRNPGGGSIGAAIAQYPVLAPITWMNSTWIDAATYSWKYTDPTTFELATSDEQELLTVTYAPDYTSPTTSRNNLYAPPTLTANAPGATEGSYTEPYDFFQAGGKPEFVITNEETSERELWETGLIPYNFASDGSTFMIVDDPTIGDMAIPIFGHNVNTDKYWLNYTMNGEEPGEGDDVRLTGIMNFIYPATAPLVVTGVHVLGVGDVSDNAEFTVDIYYTSDEYVPNIDEPLVTAHCSGKDMARYEIGTNELLTIPFDFETPVVLDNSHAAYIVKFSGFNSPEVTYFAPMQSYVPNKDYLCHGYLWKEIKVDSPTYRESFSPIANTVGDFGDCYNAFAIHLDGFYPWLDTDTEEIAVPNDGTPVTVALSSYYNGEELEFDAPAGVEASATGRYGDCVLTLSHNNATEIADGELTIKAPGVSKTIKVSGSTGAINSIAAEAAGAKAVAAFTPDGRQVRIADARGGIFIVKYSDGTTRKAAVK